MALPVYLALTGAEFRLLPRKPAHLAWMGVSFTENGTLGASRKFFRGAAF